MKPDFNWPKRYEGEYQARRRVCRYHLYDALDIAREDREKRAEQMIDTNKIDVSPIISHSYPLEKAVEAFEIACDRSRAVKVQLTF